MSDNITITAEDPQSLLPPAPVDTPVEDAAAPSIYNQQITNIQITDENVALNVMVTFLNLAQKRGAFGIDEAAKIWECIQKFIQRQ